MQYVTFNISSLGFVAETKEALVTGIVESIRRAHENLEPGHIYYNSGEIYEASINRSPASYLANPAEERAAYSHNTDREMFQLNFISSGDSGRRVLGVVNWFAVHPTSMDNTNSLVSGDNKGAASIIMEKKINGAGVVVGKGPL